MRKIKNRFHPNIIASTINKIMTLPLNLMIKYLYPRLYRLDDILTDFSEKYKHDKELILVK
jgi:hypothetical protein